MNRTKGASLLAMSLAGLVYVVSAVPGAMGSEGDQDAGMESVITTEEECTWKLLNAPSSISLTNADPDAEYEGLEMTVSATIENFDVHSTGNMDESPSISAHNECTFYGTGNVSRPIVDISINAGSFSASAENGGADANLDFTTDVSNALDFSWADQDCDALVWTQSEPSLYSGSLSATLLEITDVNAVTDPVIDGLEGSNDRCLDDLSVEVVIPANMKPLYPGEQYTWSGPTLTTALTTSTSND